MYCHKVKFVGLPTPVFACSLTATDYHWINENVEGCIEISFVEGQKMTGTINGIKFDYPSCLLNIVVGGENATLTECSESEVCINTVAVKFEKIEWELINTESADTSDSNFFLLPCWADAYNDRQPILRLIKSYISHYVRDTVYDNTMCVAIWFELLAILDRMFRTSRSPKPFSVSEFYIKKINSILTQDYMKKIRISDIAAELGVSPNYLSTIYRRGAGETFTNSLNRIRMQRARELALDGNLTTRDIAARIGLLDEGYLRKLFKRTWGVGINECRLIDREVTLYHKKPWLNNE